MKQSVLIVSCLICLGNLAAQRSSPCLCDPLWELAKCDQLPTFTTATPGLITPAHNRLTLSIKDDPQSLDAYADARYKAFWIWGDGNFRHFTHGDKEADLQTYTQVYNYPLAGDYNPIVVLTEKKSDKQPPGRTQRNVKINDTRYNPDAFVRRLNVSGKTADIFSTEDLRSDTFPTAFVISAPKNFVNIGMFLFYNSVFNKGKGAYLPAQVHSIQSTELPAYVKKAGLVEKKGTMLQLKDDTELMQMLSGGVYTALKDSFDNYIFLPMNGAALENMPRDFDEYRFFPILETIWPDTLTESQFLLLVAGTERPSLNGEDPFYDEKKISSLSQILTGFFSNMDTTGNAPPPIITDFRLGTATDEQGNSSQVYVRGADQKRVPLVGSIDPNELEVLKICPKDSGKYVVTMRLQICNEGYLFENEIGVRLVDYGNYFTNLILPDSIQSQISAFRQDTATFHQWTFTWNKHLEGIYDPANPNDEYAPQCADFEFTVETDWAGVQKLQSGEGLEMCVKFSMAIPEREETGFNFPISGIVTPLFGYKCGGGVVPGFDWCCLAWWLVAILAVLLIIFIYLYFKKKNTP